MWDGRHPEPGEREIFSLGRRGREHDVLAGLGDRAVFQHQHASRGEPDPDGLDRRERGVQVGDVRTVREDADGRDHARVTRCKV